MSKQKSKIWIYLNNLSIDLSDKAEVERAKKIYYRNYDRELKQRKRILERREFTVSFANSEIQHVLKRAKLLNESVPSYLKYLVKSDLQNVAIVELMPVYCEILQILRMYWNAIEEIEAKETKRWFGNNDYDELRKILESIKDEIAIKKK